MTTYNQDPPIIEAQLLSILKQSRLPDEVLVCDDGSTASVLAEIERLGALFPPGVFRLVVNQTNLRCDKNHESSIDLAKGDVIFPCDADDAWFQNRIEVMMAPFEASADIGLVYCNAALTNERLEPTGATLFEVLGGHAHLDRPRSVREVIRGPFRAPILALRSNLKPAVLPLMTTADGWGWEYWISFVAHAFADVEPIPECLMFYRRWSGAESNFEKDGTPGWMRDYRSGLASSSARAYDKEVLRWQKAVERLEWISALPSLPPQRRERLHEYLDESRRKLAFSVVRRHIKAVGRFRRVGPAGGRLLMGDYHRYSRGAKTFLKDVLVA